jgi:flagellar motor switch protein FliM
VAEATIEQVLALKVGDFLELERPTLLQAAVDGVPVLECHYGTHNGKYALKVERMLRTPDKSWTGDSYDK